MNLFDISLVIGTKYIFLDRRIIFLVWCTYQNTHKILSNTIENGTESIFVLELARLTYELVNLYNYYILFFIQVYRFS